MNFRTALFALTLGLLSLNSASAQEYQVGDITVKHPWARATVVGQPSGGGFLTLQNKGKDDKLVAIRTNASARAELHSMELVQDVMRMREVGSIALPSGQQVELKPGAFHVMFMQLKAPLKAGETFPATLVFEKAGEVRVDFKVEPLASSPASGHGAGNHGHAHH